MEIYLDNAATTKVESEVVELMNRIFSEDYGNPSSLHKIGYRAEQYISEALNVFSGKLKWKRKNVIFTSGGTESNNTALIGTALFRESRGKHIITTEIEHPSVSEPLGFLESRGWEVEKAGVNRDGVIDPEELKSRIRPDTVLVSVMHVNNETGSIQPVEEVGKLIKEVNSECLFHVDDIQGFGKLPLDAAKAHIDLLTASSHKLHGPKGVGLLYLSDIATHIKPLMYGGGQQNGLRSGTVNVPGIAGFAKAAELIYKEREESFERISKLREGFVSEVQNIEDVKVNGGKSVSPYIVSLTVRGVRSEVMLHALENRGIYVSAGSACSSHKKHVSPTLKAIGLSDEEADETIRLSFNRHNSEEEAAYTAAALKELIPSLRRFKRR